jgi:hypothetical protein
MVLQVAWRLPVASHKRVQTYHHNGQFTGEDANFLCDCVANIDLGAH